MFISWGAQTKSGSRLNNPLWRALRGGVRKEFNTEAAIPQICDAVSQPHHPTGLEAVLPGAGRK